MQIKLLNLFLDVISDGVLNVLTNLLATGLRKCSFWCSDRIVREPLLHIKLKVRRAVVMLVDRTPCTRVRYVATAKNKVNILRRCCTLELKLFKIHIHALSKLRENSLGRYKLFRCSYACTRDTGVWRKII